MTRNQVYLSGQSSTELWVLELSLSTVRSGRSPESMCASYLFSEAPQSFLFTPIHCRSQVVAIYSFSSNSPSVLLLLVDFVTKILKPDSAASQESLVKSQGL